MRPARIKDKVEIEAERQQAKKLKIGKSCMKKKPEIYI